MLSMPALIRGYSVGIWFERVVLYEGVQVSETNKRPSCLPLPRSYWELAVSGSLIF